MQRLKVQRRRSRGGPGWTRRAQDGDDRLVAGREQGLRGHLQDMQETAGNRAVVSLLDGMGGTRGGVSIPDLVPAAASSKGDGHGPVALPDLEPDEVAAHEKGAGELKEDGSATGSAPGSRSTSSPDGSGGSGLRLELGGVDVDVSTPEVDGETGRSRADTIAGTSVTNTFNNPDTSPSKSAFGSESFKAGFKNAVLNTVDDKVMVSFTLDIQCPWGTNDGGRTDVPSATSGVVTKDSYKQIVSDLTPSLKEKSWRAPRTKYWSEAICKRHERYHSTDDKAWAQGAGQQVVRSYLAGKAVDKTTAAADVNAHLANAVKAMDTANFQFYTGGAASYLSYAGEERAFGDGKQPYLDLVAGVKAQGEKLEAAAKPAETTK